jgi:hypothetical protein
LQLFTADPVDFQRGLFFVQGVDQLGAVRVAGGFADYQHDFSAL